MDIDTIPTCTISQTGRVHSYQRYVQCSTCCGLELNTTAICLTCAVTCHQNHQLSKPKIGLAFCDCADLEKNICKCKPVIPYNRICFTTSTNLIAGKIFYQAPTATVFSPVAINYALSLLLRGTNSPLIHHITTDELFVNNNRWADQTNPHVKLAVATVVNQTYRLKQSYIDTVSRLAVIQSRDFSTYPHIIADIDNFIKSHTNGQVTWPIASPTMFTPSTAIVSASTFYVNCPWATSFKPIHKLQPFGIGKCKTYLSMMTKTDKLLYYEDHRFQMCLVPYANPNLRMVLVLPKDFYPMTKCVLDLSTIRFLPTKVKLTMPKFIQCSKLDVTPMLHDVGYDMSKMVMNEMFVDAKCMGGTVLTHDMMFMVDVTGMTETVDCVADVDLKFNRSFLYGVVDKEYMWLVVGDYQGIRL